MRSSLRPALCLLALTVPAAAEETPMPRIPGVETTRVTLTLVDVEVFDEDGRPLPGLTADDFTVRLDRRRWPIHSVDDFCPAEPRPPEGGTPSIGEQKENRNPPGAATPGPPPADLPRFVMYLDFSQLQQDGRARSLKESRQWIRDAMLPTDEVMVVAYATASGLRTLAPFTADKSRLLEVIEAAFSDLTLVDPWPSYLDVRVGECTAPCSTPPVCPPICEMHAWSEFDHGRRSRQALHHFTEGLGLLPGRKVVIYFNQNSSLHPGRFYGREVDDHEARTEMLGATASEARAVIYPGLAGNATDFDEALAAYTRGEPNRPYADLAALMEEIRRRSSCLYRIGLLPPEDRLRTRYPLRVEVRGRIVADERRVRILSERERWLRDARAVLSRPASASALPLAAAIVPLKAGGKDWDLQVLIAVTMESVTLLPSSEGRIGRWEVGALLIRDDGKETWEMLGTSEIRLREQGGAGTTALHQREFHRMSPGTYRLVAFVRDATINAFGGSEAGIELPDPRGPGIAGPILMSADRRLIDISLPMTARGAAPSHVSAVTRGLLPLDRNRIDSTGPLTISTWLCGDKEPDASGSMVRYLAREEIPFVRFGAAVITEAGTCRRIDDTILPRRPSGRYAYHYDGALDAEMRFEVVDSSSP